MTEILVKGERIMSWKINSGGLFAETLGVLVSISYRQETQKKIPDKERELC